MKTTEDRFWAKVNKNGPPCDGLNTPCWMWGAAHHSGYGRFVYTEDGGRRQVYAHRFAWELTNGPIPEGQQVRHKCDRGSCVNPDHLILGTQLDNVRDAVARKRFKPSLGEWNPFAKLTDAQVIQIRERRASGETLSSIAKEFGCSEGNIMDIARGLSWKHVGGPIVARGEIDGKRTLTAQDEGEICKLYAAGRAPWTLAERFGVSHSAIHAVLRRRGESRRRVGQPSKTTPELRKKIRRMYKPGVTSMQTIADQLGLAHGLIFRVIRHQYLDD